MIGFHPWLRGLSEVANECPIEPGFFRFDGELFYVTLRGWTFHVRDRNRRYCLVPTATLPASASWDTEAEDDRLAGAVAEAADTLDAGSIDVGWYTFRGYVFHCNDEGNNSLVYATSTGVKSEAVVEIPAGAVRLGVVPVELRAIVNGQRQPIGGTHG